MSGAVKTVVSVVASIAIPFVAPAIASSIGLSAAIGATAGSAVVGAGLGAINAAVTGGDVGRGALMGGIGGGIGGYMSAPTAAATASTAANLAPVYDVTSAGLVPAPGYGSPALTGAAPVAPPAASLMAPSTTPFFVGEGVASGVPSFDLAAARAGVDLSATPATFDLANVRDLEFAGLDVPPAAAPAAAPTAAAPAAPAVPAAAPTAAGLQMGPPTAEQAGAAFQQQMTAAGVASKPATFADALRQVPGAVAAKFSDPKALADMTLRAAGALAGSAIAGNGLSAEERALLQAQTEELRNLQQTNQALFNQRLEQAQNLIGESEYFNPEYFGLQRARRVQTAGGKAKAAGLRGLTGGARESAGRRFDLAIARDTGTAYDQGYLTGMGGRLQIMQAGLNMMPTAAPSNQSAYASLLSAYRSANEAAGRSASNFGDLYGSILGIPTASSRG